MLYQSPSRLRLAGWRPKVGGGCLSVKAAQRFQRLGLLPARLRAMREWVEACRPWAALEGLRPALGRGATTFVVNGDL